MLLKMLLRLPLLRFLLDLALPRLNQLIILHSEALVGLVLVTFFTKMSLNFVLLRELNLFLVRGAVAVLVGVCRFVGMVVIVACAAVAEESVRVGGAAVKDLVHGDVDKEPADCHNEHDVGFCYKVLMDDLEGGLVGNEEDEEPDDENVGESPQELHAVEAEGHAGVGGLLAEIEEEEGEEESDEVADEVHCVGDDGDGGGDESAHDFSPMNTKEISITMMSRL